MIEIIMAMMAMVLLVITGIQCRIRDVDSDST